MTFVVSVQRQAVYPSLKEELFGQTQVVPVESCIDPGTTQWTQSPFTTNYVISSQMQALDMELNVEWSGQVQAVFSELII